MDDDIDEVLSIKNVTWAYNTLVSTIMCQNAADTLTCDKAESLAKIFLTYFNTMDNILSGLRSDELNSNTRQKRRKVKKDISKIESTSCIVSVLSVVEEMRKKRYPEKLLGRWIEW